MKNGECLSDETLTDYLEGKLDPIVQLTCEAHLIACDQCRDALALFMHVLQPDASPEEELAVQKAAQSWTDRYSGANAAKPAGVVWLSKAKVRWMRYAIAAAVLLVLAVPGWKWLDTPLTAQELLQQMLSKSDARPFEARLALEPHKPKLRSASSGSDFNFESLSAEMSRRAATQYDRGLFYLIRKQFPEAISELQKAVLDPNAPAAVHNDLGVAYMEQAGNGNLSKAKEEFDRATHMDPQFAPAVFNLCLFYDSISMPGEAKQERLHYLQLDSTSGWADEVRLKLIP